MEEEIEKPFRVDTMVVGKWKLALAKLFGSKTVIKEDTWGMTFYEFFGKIYVTEYHDEEYHL
jgi:hypothetical protein